MDEQTLSRCEAYATELNAPESEAQSWVRAEMERRGLPMIQVSALEGRLLAVLAATVGARRVLEVGTLGGYSALWLLSLLPEDARLVTLEREPEHAEVAREAFRRAGVADRVRLIEGDARETVERLVDGPPFDLIFVDADKRGYPRYRERAADLLRPGGLLLGDNAFWEGKVADPGDDPDDATRAIMAFNRELADDPRFDAVTIPIRDGLAIARFRG